MRAYLELAGSGFRRYSRYRAAIASALFTNVVFGCIRASLLITTIQAAGRSIGGYDVQQASTYVWLGQGLLGAIPLWYGIEIAERIKSGEIAVELMRPVSALGQFWAIDLGRSASQVLPRFVPMLAVGALTTGLVLPGDPLAYLLFPISVLLGASLAFLCWLALNLCAFWLAEIRGLGTMFQLVVNLLSGLLVPISWFPDWLLVIAVHSPFPSMLQVPINVALGSAGPDAVGVQLLWVAAMACVCQGLLVAGTRRVVLAGG